MTAGPPDQADAPTMADTEPVLWPVLEQLRLSAAAQLGISQRPVCVFVIYAGNTPMPADWCDCTCEDDPSQPAGQGSAWLRMTNATTELGVSGLNRVPSNCNTGELLLTVELGVHRCAPTLDPTAAAPDVATVDGYAFGMVQDAMALHRAFLCGPLGQQGVNWQIVSLHHDGPDGGCAATVLTAQLVRGNCCPLQLSLTVQPSTSDPMTVTVTPAGFGAYGAALHWGDTNMVDTAVEPAPVQHTYTAAGTYTVTLTDIGDHSASTTATVTVPTPASSGRAGPPPAGVGR
jgi:hypothetical protein